MRLELPLPAGLPRPDRLVAERRRRTGPSSPSRCGARDGHHEPLLLRAHARAAEESPVASRLQPDLGKLFFINRRERALARHEEGGPPPSNFNEAGRRLWWRGRTLQGVMAYRGPRLRYPQSQPTRALPPRFDYRDPDASDDDDGDYDDYSGDYYRARHEYD